VWQQLQPGADARRRRVLAAEGNVRQPDAVSQERELRSSVRARLRPAFQDLRRLRHPDDFGAVKDDGPTWTKWSGWWRTSRHPGHVVCSQIQQSHRSDLFDEVIERLAAMPAAATDFRIYWDNAYCVHHLTANALRLPTSRVECASRTSHRAFVFASTSKITLAGAGLALFASQRKREVAAGAVVRDHWPGQGQPVAPCALSEG